jgi:glycosyltransferase involved in cell wall biosynthesis
MKILYIIPAFQHPSMRGSLRTYYFTRELSARNNISLLSITTEPLTTEADQEMEALTEKHIVVEGNGNALSKLVGNVPLLGERLCKIVKYQQAISLMQKEFIKMEEEESFDVILIHGKLIYSVIRRLTKLPIVADFCDATSMRVRARMRYEPFWMVPALLVRYYQVRIYEKIMMTCPHVVFISIRDKNFIVREKNRGMVVTNGVDHYFWKRRTNTVDQKTIVFVGIMAYAPNADTANVLIDDILPIVRRSIPDLNIYIVGRNPTSELLQKGRDDPAITITGFVDDVRPYMENAALSVIPMRYGSGVQNKVLEAMSMEVPVVTTKLVEEGLQLIKDQDVPVEIAGDAKDFSERIVQLLGDEKQRNQMAVKGRRFVEDNFDWSRNAKILENICHKASMN